MSYVYTSKSVGGSQGRPWGMSAGGTAVSTIHRDDCSAIRHMSRGPFGTAKPFPGEGHSRGRVRNLLNVRLCGRCKPDHDELIGLVRDA